jgi:DNA-binding GntR family transcriptional regulator
VTVLDRKRTSVAVAAHIRQMIFNAELRAGDKVDRVEIADTLKISQIPVREAIDELTRDGLLIVEFHRGAFVAPLSRDTVMEHFDLHGVVTSYAAAQVVRKGTAGPLIAQLGEILAAFDPAGTDLPYAFYRSVRASGGGPALHAMLNAFGSFVPPSVYAARDVREDFLSEGRKLVDSLRAGDITACGEAIVGHTHYVGEAFLQELRERGVLAADVE